MDPTKIRLWHLLGIIFTAALAAALLRHFLHVAVGLSRKEILAGALIAATVSIFLTVVIFRRRHRR
jgi:predicted DNA-binding protein with PD1-like motif